MAEDAIRVHLHGEEATPPEPTSLFATVTVDVAVVGGSFVSPGVGA